MKWLVCILLIFFSCIVSAQNTSSNKPDLAKNLLDSFGTNAEMRGIETRERLGTINKILFLPGVKSSHWHKNGWNLNTKTLFFDMDSNSFFDHPNGSAANIGSGYGMVKSYTNRVCTTYN